MIVSRAIAAERHLRIGDSLILPSPRPTALRLAALSTNLGWPPGAIVLNAEDYARAWASGEPSAYQVDLAPGTSRAAGAREVRRALGAARRCEVQTAGQRERELPRHRQRRGSRA